LKLRRSKPKRLSMIGKQLKLLAEGEEKTIPPQKMMRCGKAQHPAHQVLSGT
jgi:hypothetical protein